MYRNLFIAKFIRKLEPNCQSYSYSSVPRLLLAKILFAQRFLHPSCTLARNSEIKNRIFQLALKIPTVNKHLPVFLLGTELCIPLKIFAGLSKHLPVFLLGTENVVGGGWMAILVVVCGKICGKMCGKMCGKVKKVKKKKKK